MQDENILEDQVGLDTMPPEFVPVTFAATREDADRVRDILDSFNIPALSDDSGAGECADAVLGRGLPVLVPEHMHDRASDVIAELESATSEDVILNNTAEDEDYDDEGDEEGDDDVDDDFDELDDDLDEDFEDEDFDDDDDEEEEDDELDGNGDFN